MSGSVYDIAVRLSSDVTKFNNGLGKAQKKTFTLQNSVLGFAKALGVAFSAYQLVEFAKQAIQLATDFDLSMHKVNTFARLTKVELGQLEDKVLDLSRNLAIDPTAMNEALYSIYSAGFKGADALNILEKSTMAAIGGFAEAGDVGKAVVSVLNAYGLSAGEAEDITDILFATVEKGINPMDQLVSSMGSAIATAAKAGVPFATLMSALATMTSQGISTDEAFTSLNRLMLRMIQPTEALKKAWLEATDELPMATIEARGFEGAMVVLQQITQGMAQETVELQFGIRDLKGAFALTGDGADLFKEKLGYIGSEAERTGLAMAALEEVDKSYARHMETMLTSVKTGLILLGKLLNAPLVGFQALFAIAGELSTLSWGQQARLEEIIERYKAIKKLREDVVIEAKKQKAIEDELNDALRKATVEHKEIYGKSVAIAELAKGRLKLTEADYRIAHSLSDNLEKQKVIEEEIAKLDKNKVDYAKDEKRLAEDLATVRIKINMDREDAELMGLAIFYNEEEILRIAKERLGFAKTAAKWEEDFSNKRIAAADRERRQDKKKAQNTKAILELEFELANNADKLLMLQSRINQAQLEQGEIVGETDAAYLKQLKYQKEIRDLQEQITALNGESADSTNKIKDNMESIASNTLSMSIDVPNLSKTQLERLKELITAVNGVKGSANINLNFPKLNKSQVTGLIQIMNTMGAWMAVAGGKPASFDLKIDLPAISSSRLSKLLNFLTKFSALKFKTNKLDIGIALSDISVQKIDAYTKLIQALQNGANINIGNLPDFKEIKLDTANLEKAIGDMPDSLRTIADLKGVIFA